jgi:hypothetical protein
MELVEDTAQRVVECEEGILAMLEGGCMAKFKNGDRVRYVGPRDDAEGGLQTGDIGTVLIAEDYNGDAHITFEPSGAGIWSPKHQEHLELVGHS